MNDRPYLESVPSVDGLARLAGALGGGAIKVLARLGGGLDCATHVFVLDGQRYVLKRARPGHDSAALELANLRQAGRSSVPTPEPVAVDVDGEWFGTEALVMTALDGTPTLFPRDLKRWLDQLAAALAQIHDTPVDGYVPHEKALWRRWEPWTDHPDQRFRAISEAVSDLQDVAGEEPEVFSHNDFHPGNALFTDEHLSGIVDWRYAGLEPRQAAVAYCRKDLAIHPGGDAPDQFLAAYQAHIGAPLPHMPLWDALYGSRGLEWGHRWVPSFAELGVHVTKEDIYRSSASFVDQAIARAHQEPPTDDP